MGNRLHVLPASVRTDGGGTSKVKSAWLYWKQDGTELVLRIDDEGNVLRHGSGPVTEPSSYQDVFTVEEGAKVEAAYSLESEPLTFEVVRPRFEHFTIRQTLSATLASISRVTVKRNGERTVVKTLPKATVGMKEVPPVGSKVVMIVPEVSLADDPPVDDLNGHARKFGQQWKDKDPANRELVFVRPGPILSNFTRAMSRAATLARGRTVIINVGHGSDDNVSRRTAFFDMTPRTNNQRGQSVEATGAMFRDDIEAAKSNRPRDERVLAFEQVGQVFENQDVRLFVVLACRVGGAAADLFIKDVSFFLRTAVMGYKQKILFQGVTDESFVMRSATLLEIEGSVPVGLPATDRRFTEIPNKFQKTVPRQITRTSPDE